MVVFRLDAGPVIGSGHIMRCLAIAGELPGMGEEALFVVSDEESAALVSRCGGRAWVIGGDPLSLSQSDGARLGAVCRELEASSVLVDTYAASDAFFAALTDSAPRGTIVSHIDDCFTFSEGRTATPRDRGVDLVVNYGFAFREEDYRDASVRGARVLVGPRYAPVRAGFSGGFEVREQVERVMVTSGSTNPGGSLERMVAGIRGSGIVCRVLVVVGRQASFDESCLEGCTSEVYHDVSDMAELMRGSDVVVSAAGTTLYELACVGVPTIALPIVENQLPNAEGFSRLRLGPAMTRLGWSASDVSTLLPPLADVMARHDRSNRLSSVVDGKGARYIAQALCTP